jgi:hypothetical protein
MIIEVITDVHARYYGEEPNDQSLTAGANARIGKPNMIHGSARKK